MANLLENQAVSGAKNFWEKLSLTQKIIGGSVITLIFSGLLYLIFSGTDEKYVTLFTDLDPADAGKITETLKEDEIPFIVSSDGTKIEVPADKVNQVRVDLANKGLPENSNVGYELFDKTNLGMSEFVQKLNFRRALEGELAKTIEAIDEVKKARVHIVIPEKALFKKDQKKPSASVTLSLKSGRSISKISVEGIQNLIANSVEGLTPEDVKVMDQKANILSTEALDENSIAGKTALQYQQQQRIESYLANKIQTLLDGVLGPDNTKVSVNSELDFTQIEQEKIEFDPEGQVARSEQSTRDKSESADSLSYPYVNQAKDESNLVTNYEISKNVEKIIHDVGAVKRLTVSVMINGTVNISHKEGVKTLEYIPRSNQEMEQFRELVQNAVGYDPKRNDQITVFNVPFQHSLDKDNYLDEFPPNWWEIPENQRIIFLLAAMFIIFVLMLLILQSKEVRSRMRIAMGLPATVVIDDYELEEEDKEEEMEELELDDDDLLLMPAELPEQLLLDNDSFRDDNNMNQEMDSELELEKDSLANMANVDFDDSEMSEEALMKLEIKAKVETFLEEHTADAVKLLRIMMNQEKEEN